MTFRPPFLKGRAFSKDSDMTTIVYANGVLAADTKATCSYDEDGKYYEFSYNTSKMRTTRVFAAIGAGSLYTFHLVSFLPIIMCLRLFSVAVFPYFGHKSGVENQRCSLIVAWRGGPVWVLSFICTQYPGFCLVRAVQNACVHRDDNPSVVGGSGSNFITYAQAEELGAVNAIRLAATQDEDTNDVITAFDTRAWRLVETPFPLHPSRWARARAGLTRFRQAMFAEFFIPVPEGLQPK